MLMPCSDIYFLELRALVSLKVATKGDFRGENVDFKVLFLKQKRRSATKNIEASQVYLEWSYLVQIYIFLEVSAHFSLKVATDDSFRGKQTMKIRILSVFF